MINISDKKVQSDVVERKLQVLDTLYSPKVAQTLYRWILGIIIFGIICLFLPWRQNVRGKGYVTALTPQDRPQNIQNAVAGQIQVWKIREGDYVKKGDTLVVISEVKDDYFDPQVLTRTQEQIQLKDEAIAGYRNKIDALLQQQKALEAALKLSLEKARNKLYQARLKVKADSADLVAAQRNYDIAKNRLERGEVLLKEGAISLVDVETRRLKVQDDQAKVLTQSQKLSISRNELINAQIELGSVTAEYQKEIAKSISDRSSAQTSLADGASEKSKLQNKYENIRIRREQYIVRAPQDGYIVKSLKAGIGETIKEGESIATLQPNAPEMAVELYIRAMDLALIAPGEHVRLEFDGWPALQFSGWPGVSVGTFGGVVTNVDQVSSANGEFRILVKPDHLGNENEKWPRQLRIGSGVKGFILLKDVRIWWELWRQLNGFPPDYLEGLNNAEPAKKK